jgi:hypothetical protein
VGGYYNQNGNYGLFYLNYYTSTTTNAYTGSRFLFCAANSKDPQCSTAQAVAHPMVKISY